MWNLFGYAIACAVFGNLVPSSGAAGLLGSLLGDNDSNNNNPNIPLIGSLGIGSNSNRNEQNRLNNNYNQYSNNNNQYANNNEQYRNNNNNLHDNNVNRGLLFAPGVNANANRPNVNNLHNFYRYPNTGQNNSSNVNDIKNQMKEAEKLLERLKELNRLKEQQKLEKENANNQGQTQADTGKEASETDENNVNINGDSETNGELKSLTKQKFYFMVKPVVPENEASKQEQTVYYSD